MSKESLWGPNIGLLSRFSSMKMRACVEVIQQAMVVLPLYSLWTLGFLCSISRKGKRNLCRMFHRPMRVNDFQLFYPMCGHYRNISSQALAGSLFTVWSCDICIHILQQLVKLFSDQIRVFYWDYVISRNKDGIRKVSPANWHRQDSEDWFLFSSKILTNILT